MSPSPRVKELTDGARPERSRGAHDRELTVVPHAHGIDGQASVVCRSRSRPGGDLSLSSTSSSPVRSRSASETKEERWRARSRTSVATGDHATPSRRRVPLGLSHLVEMRRRDRLANQPTIGS